MPQKNDIGFHIYDGANWQLQSIIPTSTAQLLMVNPTTNAIEPTSSANVAALSGKIVTALTVTTLTSTTINVGAINATGAATLSEQTAPATPAANKASLYLEADAAGSVLRIKFDDGTVKDIATNVIP